MPSPTNRSAVGVHRRHRHPSAIRRRREIEEKRGEPVSREADGHSRLADDFVGGVAEHDAENVVLPHVNAGLPLIVFLLGKKSGVPARIAARNSFDSVRISNLARRVGKPDQHAGDTRPAESA